jgi:hypothetical protein
MELHSGHRPRSSPGGTLGTVRGAAMRVSDAEDAGVSDSAKHTSTGRLSVTTIPARRSRPTRKAHTKKFKPDRQTIETNKA